MNWKSLSKDNIETYRTQPGLYCRGLIHLKMYQEFIDCFYDKSLHKAANHFLKTPLIRKALLKDKDEKFIINLLDSVDSEIRTQLLRILIEMSDTFPLSISIGESLLHNISQHLWINDNIPEILSLQKIGDLEKAFWARIHPKHAKTALDLWNYSIDPTNNAFKKVFTKSSYVYLNSNHFVCSRVLRKRKSFGEMVVNLFIESIKNYEKSKKNYINFVIRPFSEILVEFKQLWISSKELKLKLHNSILGFPFYLTKKFPIAEFLLFQNPQDYMFPIGTFLKTKVISGTEIFEKIIPTVLQHEMNKEYEKPHFIKDMVANLIGGSSQEQINFLYLLKQTKKNKEYPLSCLWDYLIKLIPEILIKEIKEGKDYQFRRFVATYLPTVYIINEAATKNQRIPINYDESIGIVKLVVRTIIKEKEEFIKLQSPNKYSEIMMSILKILIQRDNFYPNLYKEVQNSYLFTHFNDEERDEIITEAISDPTGAKMLNMILIKELSTTPLSIALLISDFKKMTISVARSKAAIIDEFGFIESSYSFPPTMTQNSQENEEYKGKISIFESLLFNLIKHKNLKIAKDGYTLYFNYLEKLASFTVSKAISKENNNQELTSILFDLVINVHYRLCRFLICGNNNSSIQRFAIQNLPEIVCNPLIVFCGINSKNGKFGKNWINYIYENIIYKIPYSNLDSSLVMFDFIQRILPNSFCSILPGIDKAFSELIKLLAQRLYQELPPSFEFSNVRISFNKISEINNNYFANPEVIKSIKTISSARSEIEFNEKLIKKLIGKLNNYSGRSLSFLRTNFVDFINPNLFTKELIASFERPKISFGSESFREFLNLIFENKIKNYMGEEKVQSKTTTLTIHFINFLKNYIYPNYIIIKIDFPEIANEEFANLFKEYDFVNCLNRYRTLLSQYFNINFPYKFSTFKLVNSMIPKDEFLYRLFDNEFNYDLIDEVLTWTPKSEEEIKQIKKKPIKKLHYCSTVQFSLNENSNKKTILYLQTTSNNCQINKIKKEKCQKCGLTFPNQPFKGSDDRTKLNSPWIDFYANKIFEPLFKSTEKEISLIKTDGNSLLTILNILNSVFDISKTRFNSPTHLFSHLFKICFEDILTNDPKPDKNNPTPKPIATLFQDEEGQIIPLPNPIPVPKKNPINLNKNQGLLKYLGTKILIGFISNILNSQSFELSKINFETFNDELSKLLNLQASDLKKRIGEDNYGHFIDLLSKTIISYSFKENAVSFNSCFFDLFKCNYTSKFSVLSLDDYLVNLQTISEKTSIIKIFKEKLEEDDNNFSNESKIGIISWLLDQRYVGLPLPLFSIEIIEKLSKNAKLHIDLRKTIISNVIAYWKSHSIINLKPNKEEFEKLKSILDSIFLLSKGSLSHVFCQLTRPKFCRNLTSQSPIYSDLMPKNSTPDKYIFNHGKNFGELSMPRKGIWQGYHELFVANYIGGSLVNKDENILQLIVQVLTKLNIKGGETAEKIAPFVIKALKDFNVLIPSAILMNFLFNFCIQKIHQNFEGIKEGFILIFNKLRTALDNINSAQIRHIWLKDEPVNSNQYEPIEKLCNILIACLEDFLTKNKVKDDLLSLQNLSKLFLVELIGKDEPTIFYQPFNNLLNLLQIITNDDLISSLTIFDYPSSDAITFILKFIKNSHNGLIRFKNIQIPSFLNTLIQKHQPSVNLAHLVELSSWDTETVRDNNVQSLLKNPIMEAVSRLKDSSQRNELIQLLPKLSKFANLQPEIIAYGECCMDSCERKAVSPKRMAFLPPSAPPAPMVQRAYACPAPMDKMMLMNCCQMSEARPVMMASLSNDLPMEMEVESCKMDEKECENDEIDEEAEDDDGLYLLD